MLLRDGGWPLGAFIALDGMIHPDYQRRGLFAELERWVTATMLLDVPYYGFFNQKSFPLFVERLGWAAAGVPAVYL